MNESPDRLQAENERLKHAVEELSVLNDIATAIDSTMPVEEINRLIVSKCIKRMGVEQGVIRLLDQASPDQAFKTLVRVVDHSEDGLPFRLGLTLTGWILKNQKPLLSNDIKSDERFKGAADEAVQIKSVLAVPLKTRNRMIGVLSVFNKRGGSPFDANDQRLLTIIATQSAQVIENARGQEVEARLRQMEEELKVARTIQEGLCPKSVPVVEGVDLYGFTAPAREVGGDYYDWVSLPGGKIGCVVADVSGKGMPAALLMAQLQAAFKAQAQQGRAPHEVVTTVNQFLSITMEPSRFVTLFYGILDPKAHTFTYANAGHNPAFVWRKDGRTEWVGEGGLMLSPVSIFPYESYEIALGPGDGIVLYTDGITEAERADGAQWEEPNLQKAILEGSRERAQDVAERIKTAVFAFVAGNEPNDDMTLAVMVHRG